MVPRVRIPPSPPFHLYLIFQLSSAVEQRTVNARVAGSNPAVGANLRDYPDIAQPGRAPASGAGGRRLKSYYPDQLWRL